MGGIMILQNTGNCLPSDCVTSPPPVFSVCTYVCFRVCKRFHLFLVLLMPDLSCTDDIIHQPCFMELQTTSREQLVFPQLCEKLLAFYGSCRLIIMFIAAHLFSILSLTQSTPSHSISRSILILPSHQLLGLLSDFFPSHFPTTMLYIHCISPHACDMPHLSQPLGHLSDI